MDQAAPSLTEVIAQSSTQTRNGSARAPEIWCLYQHVVSEQFAIELNALLESPPCD